jgi:hypothetical protein
MRENAMRPVLFVAVLGSTLSAWPAGAQQHDGSRFENGPAPKKRAVEVRPVRETVPDSTPPTPTPPAPPPVSALPTVQAVPPGPPQKNLTGEEFRLIRVGSTVKEVLAVLGPPSSRVVVPDDDGHLRESLQYWVKGAPMGTVRLDNGRVVQIETRPK